MRILLAHDATPPDERAFDVAERKGAGHPDTVADAVADAFSVRYSSECLRRFGVVANHWVDKVCLVGLACEVDFGGFHVAGRGTCHLLGKVTERVGGETLPIRELFARSVAEVFADLLGSAEIAEHMDLNVGNTAGRGPDHDPGFYAPDGPGGLRRIQAAEQVCNDTVICAATGAPGLCARLVGEVEGLVNGAEFKRRFPATGTDVKVVACRTGREVEVVAAVPFHPGAVASWEDYRAQLAEVHQVVEERLKEHTAATGQVDGLRLRLNTKDRPGQGYLAPFGTSLGKGDIGAVGRGNRAGGVIEPLRPAGVEAPAGKNPLHHAGKIYTALARGAASDITAASGRYCEVSVTAHNGDPLDAPAAVLVSLAGPASAEVEALAREVVATAMAQAPAYHRDFLAQHAEAGEVS